MGDDDFVMDDDFDFLGVKAKGLALNAFTEEELTRIQKILDREEKKLHEAECVRLGSYVWRAIMLDEIARGFPDRRDHQRVKQIVGRYEKMLSRPLPDGYGDLPLFRELPDLLRQTKDELARERNSKARLRWTVNRRSPGRGRSREHHWYDFGKMAASFFYEATGQQPNGKSRFPKFWRELCAIAKRHGAWLPGRLDRFISLSLKKEAKREEAQIPPRFAATNNRRQRAKTRRR